MKTDDFRQLLWEKGRGLYRPMPWRTNTEPYFILVSELMLQQTQVDRVIPKFEMFIAEFPSASVLASASLADVLKLWNGLGYNRRAKYLHDAAKMVRDEFDGKFPETRTDLRRLPGVGEGTSGAIAVYAFNQPEVFIETNVRTVFFHHFFGEGDKVDDNEIAILLSEVLDKEHPREFYWALMDYGTWLKKQGVGKITQSRHYKKQSPLKGSLREMRGMIIRCLAAKEQPISELEEQFKNDQRFLVALAGLERDGLVGRTNTKLHLTK